MLFVANGISIPCKYTSYVAPIMSSKLWNDVKSFESLKHFETPYVVRLHNIYSIAESQACFTFTHPSKSFSRSSDTNKPQLPDNRRFIELNFIADQSSVIHGLAGYFDTVLLEDVMLSINPTTHSDGMFSWFPIYFPIRQPIQVEQGDTIKVSIWRMKQHQKVWYEWTVKTSQVTSPIHNPNGRSYWIGL